VRYGITKSKVVLPNANEQTIEGNEVKKVPA